MNWDEQIGRTTEQQKIVMKKELPKLDGTHPEWLT